MTLLLFFYTDDDDHKVNIIFKSYNDFVREFKLLQLYQIYCLCIVSTYVIIY